MKIPIHTDTRDYRKSKNTKYLDAKGIQGNKQLLFNMIQEWKFTFDELSKYNKEKVSEQLINSLIEQITYDKEGDIKQLNSKLSKKDAIVDFYKSV